MFEAEPYNCSATAARIEGARKPFAAEIARPRSFRIRSTMKPGAYSLLAGEVGTMPGNGRLLLLAQQLPDDLLMTSNITCGSAPALMPMLYASATTARLTPAMRLLTTLTTSPMPLSPQWMTFF